MRLFIKRLNQNEKLLKNIEEYDEKKKIKQQEPKVLGQKPVKQTSRKEKSTSVYNTSRL